MFGMVRRRNKKCSETGPKRRCSSPEQYKYLFRYYLYIVLIKQMAVFYCATARNATHDPAIKILSVCPSVHQTCAM